MRSICSVNNAGGFRCQNSCVILLTRQPVTSVSKNVLLCRELPHDAKAFQRPQGLVDGGGVMPVFSSSQPAVAIRCSISARCTCSAVTSKHRGIRRYRRNFGSASKNLLLSFCEGFRRRGPRTNGHPTVKLSGYPQLP